MSAKGPQFERDICRRLSLWWTASLGIEKSRDDIFWRTHGSGGRATMRAKRGKRTEGQEADICATDPIGLPLTKLISIECKKGYGKHSFANLIDAPKKKGVKQLYQKWIEKIENTADKSGVPFWILIVQRTGRVPIVITTLEMTDTIHFRRNGLHASLILDDHDLIVMRLENFLAGASPDKIKLVKKC